ncbi:hypothetical protein EJ110_NYTH54763 [Nymphaea thermarum]|nr:hypothetical protein EJ110_NYTH54763 [Nymphaea thermarum]
MEDVEEGYGDPHEDEEEESEGDAISLEEEDVGVSLGTTKGKSIMRGGGSSATAPQKRRGASISSVSRGRGRSHDGRTGGGRVPTMRLSNLSDSWVEEEPAAILDEDDLDFLNVEGATEIAEEGEAGEGAIECW